MEIGPACAPPEPAAGEVRIEPFERSDLGAAARILAEAFCDDPIWTAIGPRIRAHRRVANRLAFGGILSASHRHGARMRVARLGGEPVGISVAFEPGRWPIPEAAALWEVGWVLVAGPLPAWRGLRDDRAMRARHVEHPHMYLWFLGDDPALHGSGVGRGLLAELHAASDQLDTPTYLETGTPANVGFYERRDYEVVGELLMPSGPTMWRMERPVGGRASAAPAERAHVSDSTESHASRSASIVARPGGAAVGTAPDDSLCAADDLLPERQPPQRGDPLTARRGCPRSSPSP